MSGVQNFACRPPGSWLFASHLLHTRNPRHEAEPVRYVRLLLVLAAVYGLAATGCAAIDKDPIMGSQPFRPNMSVNQ